MLVLIPTALPVLRQSTFAFAVPSAWNSLLACGHPPPLQSLLAVSVITPSQMSAPVYTHTHTRLPLHLLNFSPQCFSHHSLLVDLVYVYFHKDPNFICLV